MEAVPNAFVDVIHCIFVDIGQALVKSFVERGDHVIRVDLSRTSKANDELGQASTTFYEVDLAKEKDIEKLWKEGLPKKHPRIDVLINNAASGGFRGPFHEQDPVSSHIDDPAQGPELLLKIGFYFNTPMYLHVGLLCRYTGHVRHHLPNKHQSSLSDDAGSDNAHDSE